MDLTLIQKICVWALPVLFAITIHEAAHGWAAYKLGDPTAKLLGRVSVNPLVHLDPIGSILVPLLLGLSTQFQMVFGWAKPVPITYENLKNKRRDVILVALAGPVSNLLMALFWGLCLKLSSGSASTSSLFQFLAYSSIAGVAINLIIFSLNMLPIPPLDGSKVVSSLLPRKYAYHYDKLEPYGFIILLVLMWTQILGSILKPMMQLLFSGLKLILGV